MQQSCCPAKILSSDKKLNGKREKGREQKTSNVLAKAEKSN